MEAVEHDQRFFKFLTSGFIMLLAMKLLGVDSISSIPPDCDLKDLSCKIVKFVTPEINHSSIQQVHGEGTAVDDEENSDTPGQTYCVCQIASHEGMDILILNLSCFLELFILLKNMSSIKIYNIQQMTI